MMKATSFSSSSELPKQGNAVIASLHIRHRATVVEQILLERSKDNTRKEQGQVGARTIETRMFYWLCCLCLLLYPGVAKEATVTCAFGFAGSISSTRVISADRINDGYCDCPLDGLDEPDTEACSGALIGGWAGVLGTHHER